MDQISNINVQVAWVIPIHEPNFGYYTEHLQRCKRLATDISHIAVFTWQDDYERFKIQKNVVDIENLRVIILEDYFPKFAIEYFLISGSIINVKKLFSVKLISDEFSKIIVSDSEIFLYKRITSEEVMQHESAFAFHRVSNNSLKKIIVAPIGLLTAPTDVEKAMDLFGRTSLYGWFSDLPIYSSNVLSGFWNRFGLINSQDFMRLSWETFDYILYQYHFVLGGSVESLIQVNIEELSLADANGSYWEIGHQSDLGIAFLVEDGMKRQPFWVSSEKLVQDVTSAKMLFHIDRNTHEGAGPAID